MTSKQQKKEYGLKTVYTGVVLSRTFKTAEEAEKWGLWNTRGRKSYKVISLPLTKKSK